MFCQLCIDQIGIEVLSMQATGIENSTTSKTFVKTERILPNIQRMPLFVLRVSVLLYGYRH